MRTPFILALLAIGAASCSSAPKQKGAAVAKTAEANAVTATSSYDVDSLLVAADSLVGKTVSLRGYVTHTCKHSGKRCFLVGESKTASIRVEAKEGIGGFNRELVGSQIAVKGTLRERRLPQSEIAQQEADVNKKKAEENGSAESCHAELSNIAKMQKWMKEHGKDYYAIYYVDGNEYEVLD
ncbi:MAG: hypothetical protein LBL94_08675 [Prevotellaceae bacterium]|jgi:hypothetical protein|nr:hypothetical protein [Prevotellaceae bacterium]